MQHAQSALEHIEALRHPADPPSFEVWYAYSTGEVADLKKAIDAKLEGNSFFGVVELEQLHEQFISPARNIGRVEGIGSDLRAELDRILPSINQAIRTSKSYGKILNDVNHTLDHSRDGWSLDALVLDLVKATRAIEEENRGLIAELSDSGQRIDRLQASLAAIRAESLTDTLTQLANRKHFDEALEREVMRCNRGEKPLSLLVCDVDHFKKFNDKFGHVTGDHALRLIATALKETMRSGDVVARYGGEEFAVILPSTPLQDATVMAETLRTAVMAKELIRRSTGERLGRITISIGVSELRRGDTCESLVERADSYLYAAKRDGRNNVRADHSSGKVKETPILVFVQVAVAGHPAPV
jgi:diguanylate cyclase